MKSIILLITSFCLLLPAYGKASDKSKLSLATVLEGNRVFPLGDFEAGFVLRHIHKVGFRHIILKLSSQISRDQIYFGHMRPGDNSGINAFINQARALDIKISFWFDVRDGEGNIYLLDTTNSRLMESYRRFLFSYIKLAKKNGIQSIYLAETATNCLDENSLNLEKSISIIYKGKLNYTKSSLLNYNDLCAMPHQNILLDLNSNLDPEVVVEALQNQFLVNTNYTGNQITQAKYTEELLSKVSKKNSSSIEQKMILGVYTTDPTPVGVYDETSVIYTKPVEEVLTKWLK